VKKAKRQGKEEKKARSTREALTAPDDGDFNASKLAKRARAADEIEYVRARVKRAERRAVNPAQSKSDGAAEKAAKDAKRAARAAKTDKPGSGES
jgi:hypothetical protein